jgi:predicted DsbA family dithiol-disulfide isomerase
MNEDPPDEWAKPSPEAEPSAQPELQKLPETTPREGYAPYSPLPGHEEQQPRGAFSMSRRAALGVLSALGVVMLAEAFYMWPHGGTAMSPQSMEPIQPTQPITALPQNPGCTLIESPSAEITIEEYTDFACPFCAEFSSYLENIKRDFGSRVRVVYRSLPRPAHGPVAETAARAFTAVCLQNPAVAYSYYNELLQGQKALYSTGEPFLYEAAGKFNIDIDRMKADMAGKEVAERIEQDKIRAKESGLILSPSWIIGTQGTNGTYPYPYMKQMIQNQLSQHAKVPGTTAASP